MKTSALVFLLAASAALLAGCTGPGPEGPIPPATVPPGPAAQATAFVLDFMAARARGDGTAAGLFLSPTASGQYAAGAGGLTLTGDGAGFADWALLAVEAADPSSWEARVRIESADGSGWEELLFVGVGPGPDGEARALTVRGAERRAAPSGGR